MDTISEENDFDDEIEIGKTWQRIEKNVKTIGLGDGASSGRDSTFQNHFNKGFFEGFRSGYAIGQYKGSIFAETMQKNVPITESELLMNPKVAWCQNCTQELNSTVSEIIANQSEICNKNLNHLYTLYSSKINANIQLPKTM